MSIRTRLALVAAGAVAVAVVLASGITYAVVRSELRSQFDDNLRAYAATLRVAVANTPGSCQLIVPPREFGGPSGAVQLIESDGDTCRPSGESVKLPVSDHDREVASGQSSAYFRDATISDQDARVLTQQVTDREGHTYAFQVAGSLKDVNHSLSRIRLFLFAIAIGGIGIAAALGLVVARTALAPVQRLTAAAEEVTETRDLSRRIDESGRDELSRLASTFNTMLAALEDSAQAQRRLVSDASHELRTPLTSLRTNIEVLARDEQLPPGEREQLLRDVTEQLEEMTGLVAELVELARGDAEPTEPEDLRLDLLVAEAIERTTRNHPAVTFRSQLEETLVRGVPATIERAVSNLLDNAAKWSPPDGEIEVVVRAGGVEVRDHGPGIDADDLPFVFDRFYRAPSARSMPGSGLGLAIVRQVAESNGGHVTAEPAEGGGTRMRLSLPLIAPAERSRPAEPVAQ